MEPYDYALGAEAVHAFAARGVRERERFLQIFDGLARHPFDPGDFREPGLTGREYAASRRGHVRNPEKSALLSCWLAALPLTLRRRA